MAQPQPQQQWLPELGDCWAEVRIIRRDLVAEVRRDRERANSRLQEVYHRYLKSDEWSWRRAQIFKRDPVCCSCRVVPSTRVHHLTYAHLGAEHLDELEGLCERCHDLKHHDPTLEDLRGVPLPEPEEAA